MKTFTCQGALLCLLTFSIAFGVVSSQNDVRWVEKSGGDLLSEGMEPAGYEPDGEGYHTYVCRAINGSDRIIGKIRLDYFNSSIGYTDYILCTVLDASGEFNIPPPKFEVLDAPAESLSWVPYSEELLPSAIKSESNGKTFYVCRGQQAGTQNEIVLGYLEQTSAACRLVKPGVITTENFEILVINASGKRRGVVQP